MCVILFAIGAHPRFPLIVAANRDEAYARPAAPAAFWQDYPKIYGGRDLLQGGTWLSITTEGRFAALTNYRQVPRLGPAPRSRGELTLDYLRGSEGALAYLRRVSTREDEYNGYSLIVGTPGQLCFYSNRDASPVPIPSGVHGLSNRLLNDPWPKVQQGVAVLRSLLDAEESQLTSSLFALLADSTPAPDHLLPSTGIELQRERDRSAVFIPGDTYGTRASTVVLVGKDGDVLFSERRFGPRSMVLGTTEQRFHLTKDLSATSLSR